LRIKRELTKLTEAGILGRHVFGREKLLGDGGLADAWASEHQDAVNVIVIVGVVAVVVATGTGTTGLRLKACAHHTTVTGRLVQSP